MEKTTVTTTETVSAHHAARNGLAVVGFLALVFIGIVLAIYAARYVPAAVSRIASFGSEASSTGLSVVPTTTLPFPAAAATSTQATSTTPATVATSTTSGTKPAQAAPVVGYRTVITDYPTPGSVKIPATSTSPALYGLPNLTTSVIAVGYIDNNNNFVADKTIREDERLAVEFRVTNTGTNATGVWSLKVVMPTKSNGSYEYDSDPQHSLAPGAVNTYTVSLNANQARVNTDDEVVITADPDGKIAESNENDNDATADIEVDN